jgi:hypothetical protein
MIPPRATYRLQLTAAFGFREAQALAPYLARLGVSHVYLCPILKARPGSTHGYDIVDHAEINPELGSEADYAAMIEAFRREGLGRILDFVPNHMGVGGADNPLWLDVLEWGPSRVSPAGSTSTGPRDAASCSRRFSARSTARNCEQADLRSPSRAARSLCGRIGRTSCRSRR